MAKFFNTAGLCNPDKHYMVNPLDRLTEIKNLLDNELYFTIHAPRRTGKTTLIHSLIRRLNKEGRHIALTVSFESAGYQHRPKGFPLSVALVGLRDVREYRAQTRQDSKSLGTASPFNIKAESIFLTNFTQVQVFGLLDQHTKETGQKFNHDVKDAVFHLSNGQPWLVNALANHIVGKLLKNDYTKPITIDHVNEAREALIRRRDTHLDSLVDKLKETRVKNVVQSIINGEQITFDSLVCKR